MNSKHRHFHSVKGFQQASDGKRVEEMYRRSVTAFGLFRILQAIFSK